MFISRNGQPTPVYVQTGLTDLDYSEVLRGLRGDDLVMLLPSASLLQSQQNLRDRIQRMSGGSGVPGMQSTPSGGAGTTARPQAATPPSGGPR